MIYCFYFLFFSGLVDHMHRYHADHKPWACFLCPVRTAFVKTLYRHLKQVLNFKYLPWLERLAGSLGTKVIGLYKLFGVILAFTEKKMFYFN